MSLLAVLSIDEIKEDSRSKHLVNLTLDDLFLEVNYMINTKSIIICKNQEFKILKKWGRVPKENKLYDMAYLNKVMVSL